MVTNAPFLIFAGKEEDCKDKVENLQGELEDLKTCFNTSFNEVIKDRSSPNNTCKCVLFSI